MSDREVLLAIKREGLKAALRKMPREVFCPRHKNQVHDAVTAWLLRHTMSGGAIRWPMSDNGVNGGGLSNIQLSYLTTDPVYYTDIGGSYWTIHEGTGSINTGSAGKRFIEDHTEDHRLVIYGDAPEHNLDPKESVIFRDRFLYLPSQGITTDPNLIASITYYYSDNADNTGDNDRCHMGRVRLRDEQGRPIRISKSTEHVLLVEVELELTTV
jgi:hypothetical protein